jgi:hypothetical protein
MQKPSAEFSTEVEERRLPRQDRVEEVEHGLRVKELAFRWSFCPRLLVSGRETLIPRSFLHRGWWLYDALRPRV